MNPMDQNTFFMLFNSVIVTLAVVMFYPVFKAQYLEGLNEMLKTRPVLAEAIDQKDSRSYIRNSTYCAISFVAYGVIAIGSEVDMDLATLSLFILFSIKVAKVSNCADCWAALHSKRQRTSRRMFSSAISFQMGPACSVQTTIIERIRHGIK